MIVSYALLNASNSISNKHQQFGRGMTSYGLASKDKVSRWIKEFLKKPGIEISSYGAHSTRAASSSAARSSPSISLQTIMNAARWARESAFRKFYDKPADSESQNFKEQLSKHHRKYLLFL